MSAALNTAAATAKSSFAPIKQWFLTIAPLLSILCAGCATPGLWSRSDFFPDDPPQLRLAMTPATHDILVQYLERNTESGKSRSRAYYLFQNENRVAARQRPEFVKLPSALRTIPVRDAHSPSGDALPAIGYFAQMTTNMTTNLPEFELFRGGAFMGRFNLPAYRAFSNPLAMRLFLSPVVVTMDAAGLLLIGWLEAGGPGLAANCGGGHSPPMIARKN